jgi:hypothetical protein
VPGEKKKWSKPILREITPQQAAHLLMAERAEMSAAREAPQPSARNVIGNQDFLKLQRDVAELAQSLAECRALLADCHSRLGASRLRPSTGAANANGDYRPPYREEQRASETERKGGNN